MKRYFIILIALIVLCALPVFAGTPTAENAPMPTLEDINTGNFILLNESEMDAIIGNSDINGATGVGDGGIAGTFGYSGYKPILPPDPGTDVSTLVQGIINLFFGSNNNSSTNNTSNTSNNNGGWNDAGASKPK